MIIKGTRKIHLSQFSITLYLFPISLTERHLESAQQMVKKSTGSKGQLSLTQSYVRNTSSHLHNSVIMYIFNCYTNGNSQSSFPHPLFFIHSSRYVHILCYYTTKIAFGNLTIIILTASQYILNSYTFKTPSIIQYFQ